MGAIPDFPPEKLELAASGDSAATEELVRALSAPVYYFCLAILKNGEQAEDAAQEALLKVLSSLVSFKGKSAFGSWVYSVASNHCLDLARKNSRRRETSLEELSLSGFEPCDGSDSEAAAARHSLEAALAELSEEHRTVINLRELAGMSYGEIAAATSCSEGTVKSRLFRAREELRRVLAARGEKPDAEPVAKEL
ncbi:MAG: RNA polymerase sigma factor [Elusimicrobia bacterium]|nr:RNA polymerase sigma factor [Elusimicrobiota bacterium]